MIDFGSQFERCVSGSGTIIRFITCSRDAQLLWYNDEFLYSTRAISANRSNERNPSPQCGLAIPSPALHRRCRYTSLRRVLHVRKLKTIAKSRSRIIVGNG
jgi:hypothetical protein